MKKQYDCFCIVKAGTPVKVTVSADSKEEAEALALETARHEICEGECLIFWEVQKSYTRRHK